MTFFSAFITFFLVMDAVGNVPVFLSLLRQVEPNRRRVIICRESVIAYGILTVFLFSGHAILKLFAVSTEALGIAGGIILFLIAIKMIFPPDEGAVRAAPLHEPFIVPLAIPFIAGPSTMAILILMADQYPKHMLLWWGALSLSALVTMVILLFASQLQKLLGQKLISALESLMGMILATLAVQMFLVGIKSYFAL